MSLFTTTRPQFGVSINPLDWADDFGESVGEMILGLIIGMAQGAWGVLENAFSMFDITDSQNEGLWQAVVGGTIEYTDAETGATIATAEHVGVLNIVVGAMLPVLMIFVGLQLITSIIRGSSSGFLRACIMIILGIPLVYIATGFVYMAMAGTSQLSQWILDTGVETTGDQNVGEGTHAIMALFGVHFVDPSAVDGDENIVVDDETGMIFDENVEFMAGIGRGADGLSNQSIGMLLIAAIIIALLFAGALFLTFMLGMRFIALLVMATFTPVAIFSMTWEASKAIATKWAQLSLGLLISEPAAAVIIRLGAAMGLMANDWTRSAWGLALLLSAGLMPLLVMALVNFITGGSSDQIDRSGAAMAGAGSAGATKAGTKGLSAFRRR